MLECKTIGKLTKGDLHRSTVVDWEDLHYFVAVGRTGSLSGAARELRVNHSTVFRRIRALERSLGVRLFDRLPGGYVLTAAGEEMMSAARRVEDEIHALDRKVTGRDVELRGAIRVTTTDTLAARFVQPHLFGFHERYPGIAIELIVSNEFHSLPKREADIAIRPTRSPPETLVGRRLSGLAWALYGAPAYLDRRGTPYAPKDLPRHVFVCADEELRHVAAARWVARHAAGAHIAYRSNSFLAQLGAVRAGFGLAVLPCFLADTEPGVRRVFAPDESLMSELWCLTHPDLRDTARIRAFTAHIAEAVAGERDLLEGRNPHPG